MQIRHRVVTSSTVAALALLGGCGGTADGAGETDQATTQDSFQHDRLDCDGGRSSIWSTDPGEPPPGQTVEGALQRHPGAEVLREGDTEAMAVVRADGRVVETLVLARWTGESGGWFVESGAECLLR